MQTLNLSQRSFQMNPALSEVESQRYVALLGKDQRLSISATMAL